MGRRSRREEVLESPEVLDRLASIEHERWAHWQRHLHDQCTPQEGGSLVIPAELVSKWEVQILTPFEGLSEAEKDSDRDQVRRYLPVVAEALDVHQID